MPTTTRSRIEKSRTELERLSPGSTRRAWASCQATFSPAPARPPQPPGLPSEHTGRRGCEGTGAAGELAASQRLRAPREIRGGRRGRHRESRRPGPRAGSSPHSLARTLPHTPPSSTEPQTTASARRPPLPARPGTRPAAPAFRQDPGRRQRIRLARPSCRCRSSPLAARWCTATTPSASRTTKLGWRTRSSLHGRRAPCAARGGPLRGA